MENNNGIAVTCKYNNKQLLRVISCPSNQKLTRREQKRFRKILHKWKHREVNCRIKIDLNSLSERGSIIYFKNKEKHFIRSEEPPGKEMQSVYGTWEDKSFKGKFHENRE